MNLLFFFLGLGFVGWGWGGGTQYTDEAGTGQQYHCNYYKNLVVSIQTHQLTTLSKTYEKTAR